MDDTNAVDRVYGVRIAATPERVWAAITEPEDTRAYYFGTWPRTNWEVGTVVDWVDEDGAVQITGDVLAFDPPRRLSHGFIATWGGEPEDQGMLTWEIEPDGDGSIVTLIHAGGHGEETASGSAHIVAALKAHLES